MIKQQIWCNNKYDNKWWWYDETYDDMIKWYGATIDEATINVTKQQTLNVIKPNLCQ